MSNLLDKASILLTPTAYNDGSMLSVKPENGDGDFTFSRSSAATRVNAQGLVENVQIISDELVSNGNFSQIGTEEVSNGNFSQEGSELVTNGDFATDSDWLKVNATISDGKGNLDSTSSTSILFQQNVLTVGKTYKANFDVSNYNGLGTCALINSSGGIQFEITSNGNADFYFTHGGASANLVFRAVASGAFSIDNVSVKEVGQDWTLQAGWSIGDGVATCDGTNLTQLYQTNVLTQNKLYKVTYSITSHISGGVFAKLGDNILGEINSTVGTYTEYFNFTQANLSFHFRSSNFIGSITNISVKEVGQDWTFGSSWSIGDGVANFTDILSSEISQNISLPINKKYKIKFDISNISSGNASIWIGNSSVSYVEGGYVDYSNGSYDLTFTMPSTQSILSIYGNQAGSAFTISNISLKEITDDTDLPRINYEGFSYQDSLGSEEVVNGDFSNGNSNWIVFTAATFVNSTVIFSNDSRIGQYNVGTVNVNYDIVIDIVNVSDDGIKILVGNSNTFLQFSVSDIVNNNNKIIIKNEPFLGSGHLFIYSESTNTNATIDNISVKEYLGQEVVPDSGCGSWLMEPQSTNLITQSNDLSQWIMQQNATVSSPTFVSPSGENNANLIDLSADTDARVVLNFGSASTEYTFSIYLKKHESDVNGTFPLAYYNGSNYIKTYVNLTDKWQRFSLTFTNPSGSVFGYGLSRRGTTSDETLTRCYAWGGQQEALSYPTSLIPTSGATSTRLQDIATNSGNSTLINSTEGVLYFEAKTDNPNTGSISINDGTLSNRITARFRSDINKIQLNVSGSTNDFNFNSDVITLSDYNKIAIVYNSSGEYYFFVNGVKSSVQIKGTFTADTLTQLDFNRGGGGEPFHGKAKALAVYKEALTDAQLQSLTTI